MSWEEALISAGASYLGQSSANQTNIQLAGENREWQERMSNTAHQREVGDLQAAGLNPMLSAMKGGATTPAGSVAQVQSATKDAVNSGSTAALLSASIDKLKAEAEQSRAVADNQKAEADAVRGNESEGVASPGSRIAVQKATSAGLNETAYMHKQTVENLKAQVVQLGEQGKLTQAETQLARQRIAESSAHELEAVLRGIHHDLDLHRARNDAASNMEWWGKNVRPYLRDASTIGGTVGAAAFGGRFGSALGHGVNSGRSAAQLRPGPGPGLRFSGRE